MSHHEHETKSLADAAARGDRNAANALLERYLPELRAFVRLRAGQLVRARESSSDLVQSVCREVLENLGRFKHPSESAFKQWLFREALRKILDRRDHWLAQKREVLREVPISDDTKGAGPRASQLMDAYRKFSTPSHRALLQDEIDQVERAFEHLSEDEREVITSAHLIGMSRAEIAEQMNRSPGAVRVLLHKALAKLADLLAEGA